MEKVRKTCFSDKEFSSINEIAKNCYMLSDWIENSPILGGMLLYYYANLENPNNH